ncbi:MAG TPA: glycosyltransferase, partial [Candidatus Binataceae bacterium]|nr:glycosyltransferase [Candidatus Binataceae bacterium]
ASAVGGLREAVVPERTGLVVEPARSQELAAALARLAASPQERVAMGTAGRSRVMENYSMSTMAERTLALYRDSLRIKRAVGMN